MCSSHPALMGNLLSLVHKPMPAIPVSGAPASPFVLCLKQQPQAEEMGAPLGVQALVRGVLGQRLHSAGCQEHHCSRTHCDCSFSSSPQADDQAPCQASGMRPRRRAGHQGACVLPLHRLGQTGAEGDPASLQAKGCKCARGKRGFSSLPPRWFSPTQQIPLVLAGVHPHRCSVEVPFVCSGHQVFSDLARAKPWL